MARTKASVGAKVSFGKSSKAQKTTAQPSVSGKSKVVSKSSWSGGNAYCPRETPNWQLPITRFFSDTHSSKQDGSSSSCHHELRDKTNLNCSDIDSDDDAIRSSTHDEMDIPDNMNGDNLEDLNATRSSDNELLPLNDDSTSHKIGEYFESSNKTQNQLKVKISIKNKGIGKSSKNKHSSIDNSELTDDSPVEKENVLPIVQKKRSITDCIENDDMESVKRLKITC